MIESGPTPKPILASAGRIWKATISALLLAILILIGIVWPLAYGIDVSTVGEFRNPPAVDAPGSDQIDELADIMAGDTVPAEPGLQKAYATGFKSEVVLVPLADLEEVELKAHMNKGDTLLYSWTSVQPMYVDLHGEPYTYPRDKAVRYEEVDGALSGHGRLTASFDGMHGWFWMNTGEQADVIELKVSGYYDRLEEVYRSSK